MGRNATVIIKTQKIINIVVILDMCTNIFISNKILTLLRYTGWYIVCTFYSSARPSKPRERLICSDASFVVDSPWALSELPLLACSRSPEVLCPAESCMKPTYCLMRSVLLPWNIITKIVKGMNIWYDYSGVMHLCIHVFWFLRCFASIKCICATHRTTRYCTLWK
jgi:hypothetical protein